MLYFIPEWDDRVDPEYNFLSDTHSLSHVEDPMNNDAYMWDLLGVKNVPFDGILVSIATIQENKKKYTLIKEKGIHNFLRLPESFPIMADCGAFSYINQEQPPYKTSDILKKYSEMGFNYGVSIDHLVVKAFEEKKDERMAITYKNGLSAYSQWKKRYSNDFQLIVSVQGFTIEDYLKMYHKFLNRGITHMAIGGLVRSQTPPIINLIERIIADIKETNKKPEYLHFFGLARPELLYKLKELESLGIEVAFDSASYLRRAWLASPSSQMNYITKDQLGYTAIRIPPKLPAKLRDSLDIQTYNKLANKCLNDLRTYDSNNTDLEEVMDSLIEFNSYIGQGSEILKFYRRTLEEQPWKNCPCPICKKNGIETIIFRGNNRNRRRGFHNTISFYSLLKNENQWDKTYAGREIDSLKDFKKNQSVLVLTGCTKNKCDVEENKQIVAKNLYKGILFTKVKAYCEEMSYDYMIISAKYGLLSPEDKISIYDKVLNTKVDSEQIRPSVEEKLIPILNNYDAILVVAGVRYRDVLSHVIDERFHVLKAKGIGDLIHKVSIAIPSKNRAIDDFI